MTSGAGVSKAFSLFLSFVHEMQPVASGKFMLLLRLHTSRRLSVPRGADRRRVLQSIERRLQDESARHCIPRNVRAGLY